MDSGWAPHWGGGFGVGWLVIPFPRLPVFLPPDRTHTYGTSYTVTVPYSHRRQLPVYHVPLRRSVWLRRRGHGKRLAPLSSEEKESVCLCEKGKKKRKNVDQTERRPKEVVILTFVGTWRALIICGGLTVCGNRPRHASPIVVDPDADALASLVFPYGSILPWYLLGGWVLQSRSRVSWE
jgi:hypothetical protein